MSPSFRNALYIFGIVPSEYRQEFGNSSNYDSGMNTTQPSTVRDLPAQQNPPVFSKFDGDISWQAVSLAEKLLTTALAQQTVAEKNEAAKLGRLMADPTGKAFTFAMVDEVFRSHQPAIAAQRWRGLLQTFGVPRFMPFFDRCLMRVGSVASRFFPSLVMKGVAARMRADSSRVILEGEQEPLHRYLQTRTSQGFRINVNHLGEAILGEEEATHRLAKVLSLLAEPAVTYVSVKISAIFSQINLIAWNDTLREIKARLRLLYREASHQGKFVNLDMEEYRDLALTVAAFCEVLDEPEFRHFSAGIVLQAYLPDTAIVQQQLTTWAKHRVANDGAPIKVRLVKGANLAMETVEAELHSWHPAPYATKAETDANFRRLLEYGCRPENANAVKLGVASHNLFDVALALTLRELNGVVDRVEIEMLEGMANHQARAVRENANGLLLYSPTVNHDDFMSAMAYLVRRLDENTSPENFLREMFAMRPASPEWEHQRQRFIRGWNERTTVSSQSRRLTPAVYPENSSEFLNEPDSDWTQPNTRAALYEAISQYQPVTLPPLLDVDTILQTARSAQASWQQVPLHERAQILNRVAEIISKQRFTAIAALRSEGQKAVADADSEVSEAVDFARYYARTAVVPTGLQTTPLGVVAVVSPWNFPYAIPLGGVLAALAAGNSVVLKPAPSTVQIGWLIAQQLWSAGVPKDVVQFFPCDHAVGERLISDPRIDCVVLTGSYETARKFQTWRPSLRLYAETSGKNALIVTAQADRELAIKDLVRSAFGHSGQKCSAASLAILEAEVYDDPVFRRQLRDAAASLPVGSANDPRSVVTPLMLQSSAKLQRALTKLEPGEEWLLEPRQMGDDPQSWSPGIKLGVRAGSWFHLTECFGPVLGLMRAESLAQAVEWQNGTEYGLTAGIHTLDPAEIAWWKERVHAGNLYINRPITGAIVQRQPFGGWKRSCIGPGAKAGGPNYVASFYRISDVPNAVVDYNDAWRNHFSVSHDPSALKCESNVFRYRPSRGVILRLEQRDESVIERAKLAAEVCGTSLIISVLTEESDHQFADRLPVLAKQAEFLRTIETISDVVLSAAHHAGLNWINAPIVANGRIELTRWLGEQSISQTLHRYGQMPDTAGLRRRQAVS